MGLRSSRGAALVIVLFIVALAAILAVEMSANLMVQVQKVLTYRVINKLSGMPMVQKSLP